MKSYTDINQSKKLAEILPIEGADMAYWKRSYRPNDYAIMAHHTKELQEGFEAKGMEYIPCWSLAALLNVLPFPQLSKDKLGSGKTGWMVFLYPNDCRYDSCWHDNPIDACYEVVLKLHEQNIL